MFEHLELNEQNAENTPEIVNLDAWTWKSNTYLRQIGLFSKFDRVKAAICVLFVFLSVYGTLRDDLNELEHASIYFLTVGFFIGFDPLYAFRTYLATVTRYLILIAVCMVVSSLWIDNDGYRMMTAAVLAMTVLYIAFLNKRVMLSENYKYSKEIQHARIADPENESGEAWQHWGKVSCRTLYGQIGYDPAKNEIDMVVDKYAKPVFYLVFMKCKAIFKNNDDLVRKQNEKISDQESTIDNLQKKVESLYNDSIELDEYRTECKVLRERVKQLEEENKKVNAANEYMANNPELIVEVTKQVQSDVEPYLLMNEQERAFELFRRGYRNVDVEKATGKSKSTVSGWRKKFEETLEE